MEFLFDPAILASLVTLTILEIILGIDNIIFIAVLTNKLPEEQRAFGRSFGIGLAVLSRLALLASIAWIAKLTTPVFTLEADFAGLKEPWPVSWRDLVLILGGAFLIYKSTLEIHDLIEGNRYETSSSVKKVTLFSVCIQIMILDIVFSLDSVITAIGIAEHVWIMVVAILIATATMLLASGPISRFIEHHPTFKTLAFSFLLIIGTFLIADGLHFEVSKGYIYGAIAFSLFVELLNMSIRQRQNKSLIQEPTCQETRDNRSDDNGK